MNQQRTKERKLTVRQKRTHKKSQPKANQLSGRETYGQKPIAVSLVRFLIQPPSLYVKLRYNILKRVNSPGVDYASYSWNVNGLYDVDPALASTAIPGFVEWMSLYRTYQVSSVRAKLSVINMVDEPVQVDITWLDSPVAVNTYTPAQYGNRFSVQRSLAPKGGLDKVQYEKVVDLEQLNGSLTYWGTVSQFQGSASTNPLTPYQIIVGVNSIVGGVDVDCYVTGFLEFDTHLSNANFLSS